MPYAYLHIINIATWQLHSKVKLENVEATGGSLDWLCILMLMPNTSCTGRACNVTQYLPKTTPWINLERHFNKL